MEYLVWTHDEYEGWKKWECDDLKAAQAAIMEGTMAGKCPLLTVEVPYDFKITVKEDKIGETTQSKTKQRKDPRSESDGSVRPGDEGATEELDQGSRDPDADNNPED